MSKEIRNSCILKIALDQDGRLPEIDSNDCRVIVEIIEIGSVPTEVVFYASPEQRDFRIDVWAVHRVDHIIRQSLICRDVLHLRGHKSNRVVGPFRSGNLTMESYLSGLP